MDRPSQKRLHVWSFAYPAEELDCSLQQYRFPFLVIPDIPTGASGQGQGSPPVDLLVMPDSSMSEDSRGRGRYLQVPLVLRRGRPPSLVLPWWGWWDGGRVPRSEWCPDIRLALEGLVSDSAAVMGSLVLAAECVSSLLDFCFSCHSGNRNGGYG